MIEILNKIRFIYNKIFFINEFYESRVTRFSFYTLVLVYLVFLKDKSFNSFNAIGTIYSYINNSFTCPPYFQSCGEFFFLNSLPYSYSYTFLYTCFFVVIFSCFYFAYKNKWDLAHFCLLILFIWKIIISFVFK